MSLHTLDLRQSLPVPLETLWDFIASPRNLKRITPPSMGFDIVSPNLPETMYAGMLIAYTVRPLLGLTMRWVSEITQIRHGQYFIDEQRIGPYRLWHHEHHLRDERDHVVMRDVIHYEVPLGALGDVMNAMVVRGQLRRIFEYRRLSLESLFGTYST